MRDRRISLFIQYYLLLFNQSDVRITIITDNFTCHQQMAIDAQKEWFDDQESYNAFFMFSFC